MGYALIAFGLAFLLFVLVIALKPFLIFTVMGGYLLLFQLLNLRIMLKLQYILIQITYNSLPCTLVEGGCR